MRTDPIETPVNLSFRVRSESFVLYLSLSPVVAVSGQSAASRPSGLACPYDRGDAQQVIRKFGAVPDDLSAL
jgi:hypothetical protein